MIRSLVRHACAASHLSGTEISSTTHFPGLIATQCFHLSVPQFGMDKRDKMMGVGKPDEGTDGESRFPIDPVISRKVDVFPTEATFSKLFNGVPFSKLPVCNIRVSKNNAIFSISNHEGAVKIIRSNGIEGFKNARKGTNIAAQATAISFAMKAQELGFKTIRVKIQGLGPGRMSSVKGLQMAGMDIVSITDDTRISWNPPRPRKARRL